MTALPAVFIALGGQHVTGCEGRWPFPPSSLSICLEWTPRLHGPRDFVSAMNGVTCPLWSPLWIKFFCEVSSKLYSDLSAVPVTVLTITVIWENRE